MLPSVTCICPTKNRRRWLPEAIGCFMAQSYENRRLLILSDGDDVGDIVPSDSNIIHVHENGLANIGDKRNRACELATGDIIVAWDDDDWSAPNRIWDQVARLISEEKQVTAYHTMKFTDGSDWYLYEGLKTITGIGTSLCFWRDWWVDHRFPSISVAEDNLFISAARDAGEFTNASACGEMPPRRGVHADDMMYATVHDGNTSPRDLRTYEKL